MNKLEVANKINELTVLKNKNERVLTTKQLAECYGTEENNIVKNFSNNKYRFVEGKHYYLLVGEELRNFKHEVNDIHVVANNVNKLYLWTEKGASRMCKILDTDKAWEQFDILEETYFNVKELAIKQDSYMIQDPVERAKRWIEEQEEKQAIERKAQALLIENEDLKPKGEFYDKVTQTKDLIDLGQATQLLKLPYGRNILFRVLRDRKILKTGGANHNQPYQIYVDRGYFSLVETDKIVYEEVKKKTVVTQKGLDYLRKILC